MKYLILSVVFIFGLSAAAQTDRDQLSLDVSKADAANMEQLKAFIWKQESVVTVNGEQKASALNEFSIGEDGKVSVTHLDSETNVKKKRGIRGKVQQSTAQGNLEYVQKALDLATDYTFMTKGQLLDFFEKASITEKNGVIEATSADIFMKGDSLTVKIESSTNLFLYKHFSAIMDEDPVSGEIIYGKFKSGISHATSSTLNLPKKNAVIHSVNKDYIKKEM